MVIFNFMPSLLIGLGPVWSTVVLQSSFDCEITFSRPAQSGGCETCAAKVLGRVRQDWSGPLHECRFSLIALSFCVRPWSHHKRRVHDITPHTSHYKRHTTSILSTLITATMPVIPMSFLKDHHPIYTYFWPSLITHWMEPNFASSLPRPRAFLRKEWEVWWWDWKSEILYLLMILA